MSEVASYILATPWIEDVYIFILFATIFVPLLILTYWYHTNIKNSAGGRKLMKQQNSRANRPLIGTSIFRLGGAKQMHKGLMSGGFGNRAKSMQVTVYKFIGVWLLALLLLGSLPFLAVWLAGEW